MKRLVRLALVTFLWANSPCVAQVDPGEQVVEYVSRRLPNDILNAGPDAVEAAARGAMTEAAFQSGLSRGMSEALGRSYGQLTREEFLGTAQTSNAYHALYEGATSAAEAQRMENTIGRRLLNSGVKLTVGVTVAVLLVGYDLLFGSWSGELQADDNSYRFIAPPGPTPGQQAICIRYGACEAHDKALDAARDFKKACLALGGELEGGGTKCAIPMSPEVIACRAGGGTMNQDGTCTPKPVNCYLTPGACQAPPKPLCLTEDCEPHPRNTGFGDNHEGLIGQPSWPGGFWGKDGTFTFGTPTPGGPGCDTGAYWAGTPAPPCK